MKKLCLQPIVQRKETRRFIFLLKILAKTEQHPALSSVYDDLLNKLTSSTIQTCSQARDNRISGC